jgi:hypothetical protein
LGNWKQKGFSQEERKQADKRDHEEEETNLALIHNVHCGMEAESTCQCLGSSSRHGKIHHDLHKFDILFPAKKKNQSLKNLLLLLLLLLQFFLRQKH